jgi:ABC-type transport system involved in multi-copper enzyme maturation permease subunit
MLWKDFHRKRSENLQTLFGALPICFYLFFCFSVLFSYFVPGDFATEANKAIRTVGPWANCVLLLPVVIVSARMVSQEREKRTLESLLVTALNAKEILFGKWWASVFPMRWILAIQASALAVAALGSALHPLAFVFLAAAMLVYVSFVASLGLLISTLSNTVLKATMISVTTPIILVLAAPLGLFSPGTNSENIADWSLKCVICYALSPIDTMGALAFDSGHLEEEAWQILAALSALLLVGLASWGLWKLNLVCFERVTKGGPAPWPKKPTLPPKVVVSQDS